MNTDVQMASYKKPPVNTGQFIKTTNDGCYNIELIEVAKEKVTSSTKEIPTETKELVNLGPYFPYCTRSDLYVSEKDYKSFVTHFPPDHGVWLKLRELHNEIQEHNKHNDIKIDFPYDLYYLSSPHPTSGISYVQPFMFYRTNPCGDEYIVFHAEIDDLYCPTMRSNYREINMPIYRYMQEGDPNKELTCKLSGRKVENLKIVWNDGTETVGNAWDAHHILVVNRESVNKQGIDPGKLVTSMDLSQARHKDKLIDLMSTVVVCKSMHSVVHQDDTQGIERYTIEQRPWILRTKKNFDLFCKEYNLDLDFEDFIFSQSLKSVIRF